MDQKSDEEIENFAKEFNPIDDEEFRKDLFQRKQVNKKVQDWKDKGDKNEPLVLDNLAYRHGLSPAARNVRNMRHKIEPKVDVKYIQ